MDFVENQATDVLNGLLRIKSECTDGDNLEPLSTQPVTEPPKKRKTGSASTPKTPKTPKFPPGTPTAKRTPRGKRTVQEAGANALGPETPDCKASPPAKKSKFARIPTKQETSH